MKTVKDVMTKDVEVVSPDSSIIDAAEKMKDLDVGFLPVCDGKKLRGIVTDRDIAIRAVAENKDIEDTKVKEIMTPQVLYVREKDDVDEAAEMMSKHQVRRLIVVDSHKNLSGILSLGDLSQHSEKLSGEALEDISSSPNVRSFVRRASVDYSSKGLLVGVATGALVVGSIYWLKSAGLLGTAVELAKKWIPESKPVDRVADVASL